MTNDFFNSLINEFSLSKKKYDEYNKLYLDDSYWSNLDSCEMELLKDKYYLSQLEYKNISNLILRYIYEKKIILKNNDKNEV